MYGDEAAAIGRALAGQAEIGPIYIDASLATSTTPPAAPSGATSVKQSPSSFVDRSASVEAAANAIAAVHTRHAIAHLLDLEKPDAIIIFDDRQIRPDAIAMRLARARSIPTVVAPYASTSLEADLLVRRGDARHTAPPAPCSPLARIAAKRYPAQVRDSTLFYPASVTLALAAVGELPPSPWVLGGGGAETVCTLGPDHRDELICAGVPADHIAVTGQATTDALALGPRDRALLEANLRAHYQLPEDKPIVCCAVPQHAEHGMATWQHHEELTAKLFAALAASGGEVLLSLHPKSKREDYAHLADRYGLRILDERLSSVLAAVDLFVATFSSTVRWSIGLGIPAVIIDNLASGYQAFRSIPGVTVVRGEDKLTETLHRAVNDPLHCSAMREAAKAGAAKIGPIDGLCARRIACAIRSTVLRAERAGAPARSQPQLT